MGFRNSFNLSPFLSPGNNGIPFFLLQLCQGSWLLHTIAGTLHNKAMWAFTHKLSDCSQPDYSTPGKEVCALHRPQYGEHRLLVHPTSSCDWEQSPLSSPNSELFIVLEGTVLCSSVTELQSVQHKSADYLKLARVRSKI